MSRDTVWVLEQSPNGMPQSMSPIAVFSTKEKLEVFLRENRDEPGGPGPSASWRWSEHDVDEHDVEADS